MNSLKVLAFGASVVLSFATGPAMAEQAISESVSSAQIYLNADCNRGPNNTANGWASQRKAVDRNDGFAQRYASNYGWAEFQALRAFERMR